MNWLSKRRGIPSAFGDEQPRKGVNFNELPRVRELQQKYAQSSDEEVLEAFRSARVTDSVLRFFLYTKAKERGITDKLAQEKHGKNFEFEKDEVIIFRFAETYSRDMYSMLLLLFIYTIYPMQEKTGIYAALAFSISINTCLLLGYIRMRELSYVTNRRVILNEETKFFLFLHNITSYNTVKCKFKIEGGFFGLLFTILSLPYNEHIFSYKYKKPGDEEVSEKTFSSIAKERFYESRFFCHQEIVKSMINMHQTSSQEP